MATDPDSFDDLVDDYLVDCQRRADAGEPLDQTLSDGPEDLRARLARGRECVEILAAIKRGGAEQNGPLLRQLGRFEIVSELGVGGFGIVYRARDPRTDRDVALKIPRIESLASAEHRQRFEQEARAAARLDHPNVAAILEAGIADDMPYIATTYYRGVTLSRWLRERQGPVPHKQAAELIRKLADAVEHAHEHGVLHRDIKPGNILLAIPDGELLNGSELNQAVPKLMDFGLAKLTERDEEMTRTGALVGTVRYMSPEQAMGQTKEIGPGADIYSLGAVLYELLAGRPPFSGDTDWEILRKIERMDVTRISQTRGSEFADLETICLKCLEKTTARRYATARLLADDLGRYLDGAPIRARRVTTTERVRKWARRNPAWAGLFAFATLAGLTLIGVLGWSNWRIAGALRSTREYAYGSDMRLVQDAWEQSSPADAQHYLNRYVPKTGEHDLRGIEWHYLRAMMNRDSQVVARQDSEIWSMAVSPDKQLLATGDRHGVIRIWDRRQASEPKEFIAHQSGNIDGLLFTPDGQWLISCGDDLAIRVWDVATRQMIRELTGHNNWIGAIALSPDGRWLASGAGGGGVLLWDLESGTLARKVASHAGAIRWLAMHHSRPWLASGSDDGQVQLWDYERGAPPDGLADAVLDSPENPSWRNALWSDNDKLLAPTRNELWQWDLSAADKGEVGVAQFKSPDKIMSLGALGDTGMVVEGGSDSRPDVRIRDKSRRRSIVQTLHGHSDAVRCVIGLGGDVILSGSEDGTVREWNIAVTEQMGTRIPTAATPICFAWAPSQQELLAGLENGEVVKIDRRTQQPTATLARLDSPISLIKFGPDQDRCAVVDRGGQLAWVDLAGGPCLPICKLAERPDRMAISRDGHWLAYSCKEALAVIDLHTGKQHARFNHAEGVWACTFLDARRLIAGDMRGESRCYDVVDQRRLGFLTGHRNTMGCATLSPDGKRFATAAKDKTVHVYDAHSLKLLSTYMLRDALNRVYFLPNDRLFVVGEEMFGIVNMRTGQTMLDWPLSGDAKPTVDGHAIAFTVGAELRVIDLDHPRDPANSAE
jgi:WD40 repeat protein/tRNA A-37 threonylcarbamoyl transferase component Bud32